MRVRLNGAERTLPEHASVADAVAVTGADPARPGIAVAVNGHVVRRGEWVVTRLGDGDAVEVVTAVQGGSR